MLIAVLIALALVLVTFYIHFVTLKSLCTFVPYSNIANYNQVFFIVLALFIAHIFEISIYALTYEVTIEYLSLGSIQGGNISSFMEYLYYSIVMYTSLGLGETYPVGHIRFITGIEALNGLLLITWSASFTFLAMKRTWPWGESFSQKD